MEYKLLNQRVNTLAIALTALDFEQNKTEVNRIRIEMFEKLQQMLIHGGTVEKYRSIDDLYECPLIKRDMGDCPGQKEKVRESLDKERRLFSSYADPFTAIFDVWNLCRHAGCCAE